MSTFFEETLRQEVYDGSLLSWDGRIKAAYLYVEPSGDIHVAATILINDDPLLVDLDDKGNVLGVEKLGAPITIVDLIRVLRWVRAEQEPTP
jgi:uncharacterized protein YuzE